MILLSLKKIVTTLNFFRPKIIKFWTKFGNKLGLGHNSTQYTHTHTHTHTHIYIYINSPFDYIFFLYPLFLQNFKKVKDQVTNQMFKF